MYTYPIIYFANIKANVQTNDYTVFIFFVVAVMYYL